MKNLTLRLGHYVTSALWPAALNPRPSTSGHPALGAHKPRARFAVLAAGVALALLALTPSSRATLLLTDDFTGYSGNLDGNTGGSPSGIWTKGGSGPSATIASTTALTYSGYNGGGGNYVVMGAPGGTTSKEYKGFTSTTTIGNTFYESFLLNLTAATANGNYFITLGDPTTGTTYGPKLFAKTSGAGFVLGVSKVSNTATYGTSVFSFNTTYLVVMRLTGVTGSVNDQAYVWVNPSLSSEPSTGSAECSDTTTTDPASSLGNFLWHNRNADNPSGSFDAVRVAAASTSTVAWTDLAASSGPTGPTVTTQAASSPSTSGATLNGTVTFNGGASLTDRGFYYSTSTPVTTADTKLSEGGTTLGAFSKSLGGLSVNTIYYYRAYAANTIIGPVLDNSEVSFYTLANTPTAPTVGNPTPGTLDVAIGGSDNNPDTTTYAIKEAGGQFVQSSGALGALAVYQTASTWATTTVTGLIPSTPYSFTVQARNGDLVTTSFGSPAGVSTSAGTAIPVVTTQPATSLSTSGATLNGTVTADGGAPLMDRGFRYSTFTPVTPADTQLSEGGTAVGAFSKPLSGVFANTLYYYRAYAVNSVGQGLDSSEVSFYTLANTPSAPTVGSPASTSLNVAITAGDGNPLATTYAIQETTSGNYVQTGGTLGATVVYHTAATWGTKIVAGLSYGTTYTFQVKAQNGAGTDTAFGPTANGTTTAAPLAAWDLTGSNTVSATATASIFNANLAGAPMITRGSTAGGNAANNSFRTTGFQSNGVSTANSDYFEVTLSAAPGRTLSLSTIDARFAGTATFRAAPGVSAQFAYSLDGTTFTLIGDPFSLTADTAMPQIPLTGVSDLQNVPASTTVYIRYYASGQTATGGWGFNSPSAGSYGLDIGGTVTGSSLASVTISNIIGTTLTYGGGAGSQFVLLKSPNVAAPLSGWNRLLTNTVTSGNFTIPAVGTGAPVFYRIKSE